MNITVNGEPRDSRVENLFELWREYTAGLELDEPAGFAIALNGALVRKTQWAQTTIAAGDRVEIVRPMQGG